MSQERHRYLSYMLRLWQTKTKRGWQWRGSLESPGSGERHMFSTMDHLIAFLREQINPQTSDGEDNRPDE